MKTQYHLKNCAKCLLFKEHSSRGVYCKDCTSNYAKKRNNKIFNKEIDYYQICSSCKLESLHSPKGRVCKICTRQRNEKFLTNNPESRQKTVQKRKDSGALYNYYRRNNLKKKYNLTVTEYEALLKSQNGGCAICNTTVAGGHSPHFHVDHCHITEEVRGLLCSSCNRGLGFFKDNTKIINQASFYLNMHKIKTEL